MLCSIVFDYIILLYYVISKGRCGMLHYIYYRDVTLYYDQQVVLLPAIIPFPFKSSYVSLCDTFVLHISFDCIECLFFLNLHGFNVNGNTYKAIRINIELTVMFRVWLGFGSF